MLEEPTKDETQQEDQITNSERFSVKKIYLILIPGWTAAHFHGTHI